MIANHPLLADVLTDLGQWLQQWATFIQAQIETQPTQPAEGQPPVAILPEETQPVPEQLPDQQLPDQQPQQPVAQPPAVCGSVAPVGGIVVVSLAMASRKRRRDL